jgi:hypothetical protein
MATVSNTELVKMAGQTKKIISSASHPNALDSKHGVVGTHDIAGKTKEIAFDIPTSSLEKIHNNKRKKESTHRPPKNPQDKTPTPKGDSSTDPVSANKKQKITITLPTTPEYENKNDQSVFAPGSAKAKRPAMLKTRVDTPRFKVPHITKTKMENHMRMLRRVGIAEPLRRGPTPNPITSNLASSASKGPGWFASVVGSVLGSGVSSIQDESTRPLLNHASNSEDRDIINEFDNDVATAIMQVGGSVLGISQDELNKSSGLRKLVARNIRWFQGTHDAVKLAGLLCAKKLNHCVNQHQSNQLNLTSDYPSTPQSYDALTSSSSSVTFMSMPQQTDDALTIAKASPVHTAMTE